MDVNFGKDLKKAVVLVSGGLDSATILAMARAQAYACYALSFDYGQRHRAELQAAARVAAALGAMEHKTISLDLGGIGGSALTDAAIAVDEVDRRVSKVMDFKTPGSGEAAKNRFANVEHLGAHDQVKFVICDRADYEWSKQVVAEQRLFERCEVLFSPSAQQLPARELADWIVADRLPVRFQIQLHKYLWGDEAGR